MPWTRDPDGTWRRLLPGEDVDLEALDDDEGGPDVAVVPTSILPFPWETFPRQFLGPIEGPENPRTAPWKRDPDGTWCRSPFELAFVVGEDARPPSVEVQLLAATRHALVVVIDFSPPEFDPDADADATTGANAHTAKAQLA